jgi:hypothetical protein
VLGLDGVPDNDEVVRNTPVLLEHCVDDPLVIRRECLLYPTDISHELRGFLPRAGSGVLSQDCSPYSHAYYKSLTFNEGPEMAPDALAKSQIFTLSNLKLAFASFLSELFTFHNREEHFLPSSLTFFVRIPPQD